MREKVRYSIRAATLTAREECTLCGGLPGAGCARHRHGAQPIRADARPRRRVDNRQVRAARAQCSDGIPVSPRGIRRGVVGGTPKKAKIILFWYCIFEIRVVEYKTRLGF